MRCAAALLRTVKQKFDEWVTAMRLPFPSVSDIVFAFSLLALAFAQIILGRAYTRPRRRAKWIEVVFNHCANTAVGAHLDDIEAFHGVFEHPVLAFELGDDALYRTFGAKRFAAANAKERLLLLDNSARGSGCSEVDLWL